MNKPMKTAKELILHMKNKGIKFSIINDVDAEDHLNSHNNYFKLTSYRKNYIKYTSGSNKGKYGNLEFAYLVELARLDVEIRSLLLNISLDIEHFLKVALIKAVEDRMVDFKDEDGYKVLQGYLNADDIGNINDLNHNSSNTIISRTPQFLANFLISAGINQGARHNKMSNPRINQIVHLLYTFDKIVVTDNTRQRRLKEFKDLITGRLLEHQDYFKQNQLLITTYRFFEKIANIL